ncbi:hypothetical protein ACLOJK_003669 [Asimina triloba]
MTSERAEFSSAATCRKFAWSWARVRTRVESICRTTAYKKKELRHAWEERRSIERERKKMSRRGAQMARGAEEEQQGQGQGPQRQEASPKGGQGQQPEQVEGQGLPLQSSPYVKYSDLEDYKRQAYGTEGHQAVEEGRGPGTTDAPTLSGSCLNPDQAKTVDDMHRGGTF